MRVISILLGLLFAVESQAVITKKCPEVMNITVPEVQKFSKSFIDSVIESEDFREDLGETYDSESIQFFLERDEISEGFAFDFKLESKRDSVCWYEQKNIWGGVLSVKISGTDKDPKLVVGVSNQEEAVEDDQIVREIVMFGDVTSKSPFYSFAGTELQIKVLSQKRSQGVKYQSYLPVGKAQVVEDPVFKYQVTPDTWSVDLLLDTCKGKLLEAIEEAIKGLGGDPADSIYELPQSLGYQYFNIVFKAKDGNLALPGDVITYEFEYVTEDDAHTQCTDVIPHDLVY